MGRQHKTVTPFISAYRLCFLLFVGLCVIQAKKLGDTGSTNASFLRLSFYLAKTGRMASGFSIGALLVDKIQDVSVPNVSPKLRVCYEKYLSVLLNNASLSPSSAERIYYCRGLLRQSSGDFEAAARDYLVSLHFNSDDAIARFQLGCTLAELGLWKDLFRAWDLAGAGLRVEELAHRFEEQNQWALAIEAYGYLGRLKGDKHSWQRAFSIALERQKDPQAARQLALSALQAFPKEVVYYIDVGRVYQQTGQAELARRWYRRAAEEDPESELPDLYSAGLLLSENARSNATLSEVYAHLAQALAKNPRNEQVHWWLATYYLLTVQYDRSVSSAQDAVQVNPSEYNKAFFHQHLASVYSALGRDDCAADEYRMLVANDPGNLAIRSLLQTASDRAASLKEKARKPCGYSIKK